MSLMPVQTALDMILASVQQFTAVESLSIYEAQGRVLAQDLHAKRSQPPVNMSAMDGYAVRHTDIINTPARLKMVGESAAGHECASLVLPQTCIRIFTGAALPLGADTVVMQENTLQNSDEITFLEAPVRGKNIRAEGSDFKLNQVLLSAGTRLGAAELALAAAMNHATVQVHKRPRVGILATGDELVEAGGNPLPHQIVSSNTLAVAALAREAGAEVVNLGIAPDNLDILSDIIAKARDLNLDVLVTSGGASVGAHDLVQHALVTLGCTPDFWRIAMRPGKPMMFGQLGAMRVLGLPGNPVASFVCSKMFLQPLLQAMAGDKNAAKDLSRPALLGCDVPANDKRQDYMRAKAKHCCTGLPVITPFATQDSAMLSTLAKADALLIREPYAVAGKTGDVCRVLWLD